MRTRLASPPELPVVMTVFDSAMLAVSVETVRTAIRRDRALVAVEGGRVLGAVVVDPREGSPATIEAIAVRRGRRGQGIGTALVRAAAERYGSLVAEFDGAVRPFWSSLGFDIEPVSDDRYLGRLPVDGE